MKADAGWDGHPLAARMAAALTNYDLPQKTKDILAAATDGHVSQSKILGTLIEAWYPDPIDLVLCTRVAALIERLQCREQAPPDLVRSAAQLMLNEVRMHSPIFAWLLVRTWMGGWPTAQRTQKGTIGCVFSCAPVAVDAVPDALFCPTACLALSRARKEPYRNDVVGSCVGLGSCSPGWTLMNMTLSAQLTHMYLKGHVTPSSSYEGGRLAEALAQSAVRHLSRLR